jgi:hypothetical protein
MADRSELGVLVPDELREFKPGEAKTHYSGLVSQDIGDIYTEAALGLQDSKGQPRFAIRMITAGRYYEFIGVEGKPVQARVPEGHVYAVVARVDQTSPLAPLQGLRDFWTEVNRITDVRARAPQQTPQTPTTSRPRILSR